MCLFDYPCVRFYALFSVEYGKSILPQSALIFLDIIQKFAFDTT